MQCELGTKPQPVYVHLWTILIIIDSKSGTVVPQQDDLFIRWEVWRHTEVGSVLVWRNCTLGGQQLLVG